MEVNDIVYRVIFTHLDQVYTIYSLGISEETLVGFIEVDGILSISAEAPAEEGDKKANTFLEHMHNIKRTYVPMHSVLRIDEMTKKHYDFTKLGNNEKLRNVKHIHGGAFSLTDSKA